MASVIDGINGLGSWGLIGLLLAPPGFLLGAWQTQRRIDKEGAALDAMVTWSSQMGLVHAAIDKIDLALGQTPSGMDGT